MKTTSTTERDKSGPIINVPIQFFIDAVQNNYQRQLRFFLLLKLIYPSGKTRLEHQELQFIEYFDRIESRKTTLKYLERLKALGWIYENKKTGYFLLVSLDKIRKNNEWYNRLAYPIGLHNYNKLKAVSGAVIYGYLHKDFWRKVRKKKSVQIKGCAYHFLSSNFNFKKAPAPVSVYGVNEIFDISTATASRIKNAAANEKLISLKKNYTVKNLDAVAMHKFLEYNDNKHNLVYKDGKYVLQLIDTIFPLFYFRKRKSL